MSARLDLLPPELLLAILTHLLNPSPSNPPPIRRASLRALGLTCRALLPHARQQLYGEVLVEYGYHSSTSSKEHHEETPDVPFALRPRASPPRWGSEALRRTLESNAHLALFVKEIRLILVTWEAGITSVSDLDEVRRLLLACRNVQGISLEHEDEREESQVVSEGLCELLVEVLAERELAADEDEEMPLPRMRRLHVSYSGPRCLELLKLCRGLDELELCQTRMEDLGLGTLDISDSAHNFNLTFDFGLSKLTLDEGVAPPLLTTISHSSTSTLTSLDCYSTTLLSLLSNHFAFSKLTSLHLTIQPSPIIALEAHLTLLQPRISPLPLRRLSLAVRRKRTTPPLTSTETVLLLALVPASVVVLDLEVFNLLSRPLTRWLHEMRWESPSPRSEWALRKVWIEPRGIEDDRLEVMKDAGEAVGVRVDWDDR